MIPFFLLPESFQKRLISEQKKDHDFRVVSCVDWDPKMPWKKELNIRASRYSCLNLFPGLKPNSSPPNPNEAKVGEYEDSPSGEWRYVINTIPKGGELHTWCGSKIGTVLFDGPVQVPAIYGKAHAFERGRFSRNPWMSLTPAEIMSMRSGLRFAKGHTVVAGLGLGHLLIDVTKKKTVKKVTLVEISQELVDWLYPRIKPHLGMDVEVIVGNAHTVIPGLEGDVALIDIDAGYGNNEFYAPCMHFNKVWVWGSAKIGDGDGW